MKNTLLKAIIIAITLTGTQVFAQTQGPKLSLICLSANQADQNIYHISIYEDKLAGIPEEEQQYLAMIEVIGNDGILIFLGNDDFVAKKAATRKHPNAYKFKDLKNKVKYNCEIELTATAQPGVIRVNEL